MLPYLILSNVALSSIYGNYIVSPVITRIPLLVNTLGIIGKQDFDLFHCSPYYNYVHWQCDGNRNGRFDNLDHSWAWNIVSREYCEDFTHVELDVEPEDMPYSCLFTLARPDPKTDGFTWDKCGPPKEGTNYCSGTNASTSRNSYGYKKLFDKTGLTERIALDFDCESLKVEDLLTYAVKIGEEDPDTLLTEYSFSLPCYPVFMPNGDVEVKNVCKAIGMNRERVMSGQPTADIRSTIKTQCAEQSVCVYDYASEQEEACLLPADCSTVDYSKKSDICDILMYNKSVGCITKGTRYSFCGDIMLNSNVISGVEKAFPSISAFIFLIFTLLI